jgi:aspartyl protease family protein
MAEQGGPWGVTQPPIRRRIGKRMLVWLAIVASLAACIWGFSRIFPEQLSSTGWFIVWRNFAILAAASSGVAFATVDQLRRGARHILIWCGVIAALAVGYTFRGGLAEIGERIRGELIPSYGQMSAPHTLAVARSDDGHYYVMAAVNGAPVRFLVDTGASDIVLSPADAARAGFDTERLDYGHLYMTANGAGRGASSTADTLNVGPIALSKVPISINRTAMPESLLGMTFLSRLEAYEFRDGRLFLKWRG